MRQKLEKWEIPVFPRRRASRAIAMLQRLAKLVPPRVAAAALRTLWKGWCTARRFGSRAPCLFCGYEDGDSLEHMSVCRVIARFGAGWLRLPYVVDPGQRRLDFLLLHAPSEISDDRPTSGFLRLAAA